MSTTPSQPGERVIWRKHNAEIPALVLYCGADGALLRFDSYVCLPTRSGRCSTVAREWWAKLDELTVVEPVKQPA